MAPYGWRQPPRIIARTRAGGDYIPCLLQSLVDGPEANRHERPCNNYLSQGFKGRQGVRAELSATYRAPPEQGKWRPNTATRDSATTLVSWYRSYRLRVDSGFAFRR